MIRSSLLVLALLFCITNSVTAAQLNTDRYDIYYGDVDGNGLTDVYFHGRERLVLLHGDIATPIILQAPESFVLKQQYQYLYPYSQPIYTYYELQAVMPPLSESVLANYRQLEADYDICAGDFNGDGKEDLLVLNDDQSAKGFPVILSSTDSATAFPVLQKTLSVSTNPWLADMRTATVQIRDVTGDGKDSVVFLSQNANYADIAYDLSTANSSTPADRIVLSAPTLQPASLVGFTAGQFQVNESGAATYTFPFKLLKGTAGVTPELGLAYSSQSGNGLVGKGWNITGLSGIARCRQTLAHEREQGPKPITWSAEDRFCLDGQRLVLVSGSYGAANSVYKTEIDSFATVTAKGGTTGNPAYFQVERKDGSLGYYGDYNGATDATQTTSSGHLLWAIKHFQDSAGNPIIYNYAEDVAGHRLTDILYSYGSDSTAKPRSRVSLVYEDRPDSMSGYAAGHLTSIKKRLKRVDLEEAHHPEAGDNVLYDGILVRRYNLSYQRRDSGSTDRLSRLYALQECAGSKCLPPTTFTWNAYQEGFASASIGSSTIPLQKDQALAGFNLGDINGDGCSDAAFVVRDFDRGDDADDRIVYATSDCEKLVVRAFSNGAGYIGKNGPGGKVQFIDYNVDGRSDLLVYHPSHGWIIHLAKPSSSTQWVLSQTAISTGVNTADAVFADFNSDGLVDVVYMDSQQPKIRYLERDPSQSITSSRYYRFGSVESLSVPAGSFTTILGSAGDMNGDGINDLWVKQVQPFCTSMSSCYAAQTNRFYTLESDGVLKRYDPYVEGELSFSPGAGNKSEPAGDINGDGYTDIRTDTQVMLNRGDGTFSDAIDAPMALKDAHQIDHNGDGYLDFINKDSEVAVWDPSINRFSGLVTNSQTTVQNDDQVFFADVNGDGKSDRILLRNNTLSPYLAKSTQGLSGDLITTIDNGLGIQTGVHYETLSETAHYTRIAIESSTQSVTWNGHVYEYDVADADSFYATLNGGWNLPAVSQTFGKDKPVLELTGPIHVVAQVSSTAPRASATAGNVNASATSSISYYYAEAKIQAAGRGLLGFQQLKMIDNQTGVETTTTYRQDYPFIGSPLETVVTTASGAVLSRATNTWMLKGWQSTWPDIARNQGPLALGPLQPYLATSVEKTYVTTTNGGTADKLTVSTNLLKTVTTDTEVDTYGNATDLVATITGNGATFITETHNQYGTDVWEKRFGRLSRTETTNRQTVDGVTAATPARTVSFHYYNISGGERCLGDIRLTGLLCEEIIEPDRPEYKLLTYNKYDLSGNKVQVSRQGNNTEERYARYEYDIAKRFINKTHNALEHLTKDIVKRNQLGLPTTINGLNNRTTTIQYDELGRQAYVSDSTGAWTQMDLLFCGSQISCPTAAVQAIKTSMAGGSKRIDYLDALGRTVRSGSIGFDGRLVYVDTEYDSLGRVKHQSEPFHEDRSPAYWTSTDHDILGRPIAVTRPDGQVSNIHYAGLTTTAINVKGQQQKETKNVRGDLVQVVDQLNGKVTYNYDAQGNLLFAHTHNAASTGPAIITVGMTYDHLGRKQTMSDPDKGNWHYDYNAFGELIAQTDGNGQTIEQRYDSLGRMRDRTDKLADGTVESHTRWYYDTLDDAGNIVANATGQMTAVVQSKNINHITCASTSTDYCERYTYDAIGRPGSTHMLLGSNAALGTFTTGVAYDSIGRVTDNYDVLNGKLKESSTAAPSLSGTRRSYNAYGFVDQVRDIATGQLVRQTLSTDERGQITREKLANQAITTYDYDPVMGRLKSQTAQLGSLFPIQKLTYTWDELGNLKSRHNQSINDITQNPQNAQESFCYDGLNRLIKNTLHTLADNCANLAAADQTVEYDSFGSIQRKAGVGTYTYGQNAGPHAVTHTSDGTSYYYDSNGNLVSDSSGRVLTYSSFDKPLTIKKGDQHTTTFKYGPNRHRYQRTDLANGETTTTHYLGNVERTTRSSSQNTVEWKRYLNGVLIHTIITDTNGVKQSENKKVVYKDHLGSIDVLTDLVGKVTKSMSFDPWGQRRNPLNATEYTPAELTAFDHTTTTRGFTGHEMLDEVGIIHMNGRIYDPRLGRFLQADPIIQSPGNTQSYNRYSYTINNPLKYTDPSGYKFSLKKLIKAVVVIVAAVVTYGAVLAALTPSIPIMVGGITTFVPGTVGIGGYIAAGAAAGAVSGGLSVALNGGSLKDVFNGVALGAFSGAVFGGISGYFGNAWNMKRVAANSLAGGVTSKASGGKFADGFRLSLATSMLRMGWEYTRKVTNAYKYTACAQGRNVCEYNEWGELLTDGTRGVEYRPGFSEKNNNWLTRSGMGREGVGTHGYSVNSHLGRFVNQVSKTHDWLNSDFSRVFGFHGYSYDSGLWIGASETYNTLFQFYSLAGMLPAGVYTAGAMSASLPIGSFYELSND